MKFEPKVLFVIVIMAALIVLSGCVQPGQADTRGCEEKGYNICKTGEKCTQWIDAGTKCCAVECSTGGIEDEPTSSTDLCENVNCSESQKCVDGACILKTCSEMGGTVCNSGEICTTGRVSAKDAACCIGSCEAVDITPGCTTDADCGSNEKCFEESCVAKTCSERGGTICNTGTTCSLSVISASDTAACCIGACNAIPTAECITNADCANNKKCSSGSCVLKSCSEVGGAVCSSGQNCSVAAVAASNTGNCCIGTCNVAAADECTTNTDCNDNHAFTIDTCAGSPKTCSNTFDTSITSCGDVYAYKNLAEDTEEYECWCVAAYLPNVNVAIDATFYSPIYDVNVYDEMITYKSTASNYYTEMNFQYVVPGHPYNGLSMFCQSETTPLATLALTGEACRTMSDLGFAILPGIYTTTKRNLCTGALKDKLDTDAGRTCEAACTEYFGTSGSCVITDGSENSSKILSTASDCVDTRCVCG